MTCSVLAALFLLTSVGDPPPWESTARAWVEADAMLQVEGRDALLNAMALRDDAAKRLWARVPSDKEIECAMRSRDPKRRLAATACVVVLGEPSDEIVRLLVHALKTEDFQRRHMAVRALGRADGAQTSRFELQIFEALLKDPSPAVRIEAYPLLRRMEVAHAAPVFAEIFGEWANECPRDLFDVVASLGDEMVTAVKSAIEREGSAKARKAFECARRTAGPKSANPR